LAGVALSLSAQTPDQQTEISTRDEQASFSSKVNLVIVPVVVRNFKGEAVGNLTKENFQLFDKGKLQEIARFTLEKTAGVAANSARPEARSEFDPPTIVTPDRFVALVFDDIHMQNNYLVQVRESAVRYLDTLAPTDRVAIYSLSGEVSLEFTDERPILQSALARIRPAQMTRMAALNEFDQRIYLALGNLKAIVKRLGVAPGQRSLVLISSGFFTSAPQYIDDKVSVVEQAIRSKVIINSIDARGLYTDPRFNAAPGGPRSLNAMIVAADLMAELAAGTGGTFFENSNSFDEVFKRVAVAPEYMYMLGFSPQNLKSDGSFHSLKVSLKNGSGLTLTARRGYYAPKKTDDAAETARQEIESALFSRDEMRELPIGLNTQFFRATNQSAKLTVMAHLDLKQFHFHKGEGRNNNEVTIVSGLFDRNGTYVQGVKKVMTLHLKDDTLAHLDKGVTVRTVFDVKPGIYAVRLVVRDTVGQNVSATNNAVDIQ
jgi:VWFA-related protein